MRQKKFDLEETKEFIREISGLMKELGLAEVEIEDGKRRVVLKRQSLISNPTVGSPAESKITGENLGVIKSPMPGTFYRALKPDSEPFVEAGSEVTPQTPVCIIDAMKVLNEIKAGTTGTIVEILAKNGQAIEFGQTLFKVKPSNKSL